MQQGAKSSNPNAAEWQGGIHTVYMMKDIWERWERVKKAENILLDDSCFASLLLDVWEGTRGHHESFIGLADVELQYRRKGAKILESLDLFQNSSDQEQQRHAQTKTKEISQTIREVQYVHGVRGLSINNPFTIGISNSNHKYKSSVPMLAECSSVNIDSPGEPFHVDLTDNLINGKEIENEQFLDENTNIHTFIEKQPKVANVMEVEEKENEELFSTNYVDIKKHTFVERQTPETYVMECEPNGSEILLNNRTLNYIIEDQDTAAVMIGQHRSASFDGLENYSDPETSALCAQIKNEPDEPMFAPLVYNAAQIKNEPVETTFSCTTDGVIDTAANSFMNTTYKLSGGKKSNNKGRSKSRKNKQKATIPIDENDTGGVRRSSRIQSKRSRPNYCTLTRNACNIADNTDSCESSATISSNVKLLNTAMSNGTRKSTFKSMVVNEAAALVPVKFESHEAMITSIIDGVIDTVMTICSSSSSQIHTEDRNIQFMQAMKDKERLNQFTGHKKFIVVDKTESSLKRESCRVKDKGYRPDYAAFGLGFRSDITIKSRVLQGIHSKDRKESNSKKFLKRRKRTKAERKLHTKIKIRLKKDKLLNPNVTPVYEILKKRPKRKQWISTWRKKRKLHRLNVSKVNATKNSTKIGDGKLDDKVEAVREKKRIKVNLQDHPDKYFEEESESALMQDRGKTKEEKTICSLVCALCKSYSTTQRLFLENHLEAHLNGDYDCKQCDAKFSGRFELLKHRDTHHTKSVKFKCSECPKTFGLVGCFKSHLTLEHGYVGRFCNICLGNGTCLKTFLNVSEYEAHLQNQHPDKTEACERCNKRVTKKCMRQHKARCDTSMDLTTCHICGKELTVRCLKVHLTSHAVVRHHRCSQCNYMAKSARRLANHKMAKHEGKHVFHCDQCKFSCVQQDQLKSHMKTHTGEKPYRCDQCAYAAAWNVQLKEHKKLHGLPICVTCDQCGVLMKKKMLALHKKKNH